MNSERKPLTETRDLVSPEQLKKILGRVPSDTVEETTEGEWRREADGYWRLWRR